MTLHMLPGKVGHYFGISTSAEWTLGYLLLVTSAIHLYVLGDGPGRNLLVEEFKYVLPSERKLHA